MAMQWVIRLAVAGLLGVAVLSAGCAAFTRPTNTITIERQDFVNAYARVKVLYWRAADIASRGCASGQWSPADCRKAAELHSQAKKLVTEIDAKLAVPESEIDWARIMKILELAVDILT